MPLAPGSKLNHYEIVSALGAGGMGEVYRARDGRLGREVAIKLLFEQVSADPERLARFEREARVLASLNHPNVATLHGFEQDGDTHFLVMELVEGETLADRIARGPLSLDDATPLFVAIAEGLEAAHSCGVVHRDLKPANVKITPGGVVKILDFGLAKATAPESLLSGDPSQSKSPTLTLAATQRGEILGTAAYMAPEQAQGLPTDERADIWAFGVCLWEALVGRRPFEGANVSLTLARVLDREPAWERLSGELPWRAGELLRRCLRKDPSERLHHNADVRLELLEAAREDSTVSPSGEPAARSGTRTAGVLGWAIAAALGALVAGLVVWSVAPRTAPVSVVRAPLLLEEDPPLVIGAIGKDLAISPDGRTVVYRTSGGLALREIGALRSRLLSGTEGGQSPFFSPDGQWLGFVDGRDGLHKIQLRGGAVTIVASIGPLVPGATWSEDGSIYLGSAAAPDLWRIPATGGEPERVGLTVPDGTFSVRFPEPLPGGRALLVTLTEAPVAAQSQIGVADLETGRVVSLLPGAHATYVASGHLLYGNGGTLYAVRFDPGRRRVEGDPFPVVSGAITKAGSGAVDAAVSGEGTMVYVDGPAMSGGFARRPVLVDRQGNETDLGLPADTWTSPRLSPSGDRLALHRYEDGDDLWVIDLERKTTTRLTTAPETDNWPVWRPDGSELIFGSWRDGGLRLYRRRADGAGAPTLLADLPAWPLEVSSDGELLLLSLGDGEVRSQERGDLGVLELGGGAAEPRLLFEEELVVFRARISPDGRWLAYESDESGDSEVYVRPFPEVGSGRWQVSSGGGLDPLWSPRGDELFFRSVGSDPAIVSVAVATDPSFRPGLPKRLFADDYVHFPTTDSYWHIHPDGEHFVLLEGASEEQGEGREPEVVVVTGWFDELARLQAGE